MTIGIAASGPGAARAILEALAKAERIATGAIGGFISFACIGQQGLWRAGGQRGGAHALLADGLPAGIGEAPLAVLMSSGPDRPEPLAQFTPAEAGVGLVTGHRFPNAPGAGGVSLGQAALALMRQGRDAAAAAAEAAGTNPKADAGLVCLGLDGRIGLANTAYVAGFPGLGRALRRRLGAEVGVLCNAISQAAPLADLVAEVAFDSMTQTAASGTILLRRGLPVRAGDRAELKLNRDLRPVELCLPSLCDPEGAEAWNGGYGPRALITREGRAIGHLIDEPYLSGRRSQVETFDGQEEIHVRFAERASSGR